MTTSNSTPAANPNVSSKLELGDSLTLLKDVPSQIRLLITDPPYCVSQTNNLTTLGRRGIDFGEWDSNFDQLSWLDLAIPTLIPGGSCVIFNDWKNLGEIAKRLERLGMVVKRPIILVKSNPFPRNIQRSFVQATEHALWAVKPGAKWVFNKRPEVSYETGIYKSSVQKSRHPTKKPDSLFIDLIKLLSHPEEWVLDPFVGSGTTCYAAETTQRRFICFEKEPEYYQLALETWRRARGDHHD